MGDQFFLSGFDLNVKTNEGWTPFMLACNGRVSLPVVELLLDGSRTHGIELNAKTNFGLTAFMRACFNGKVELVKLMLKHSEIDFNVRGKFGWTGLMFACFHGRTDVVKQLLNHDPDLTLPKESDIQWYSEEV